MRRHGHMSPHWPPVYLVSLAFAQCHAPAQVPTQDTRSKTPMLPRRRPLLSCPPLCLCGVEDLIASLAALRRCQCEWPFAVPPDIWTPAPGLQKGCCVPSGFSRNPPCSQGPHSLSRVHYLGRRTRGHVGGRVWQWGGVGWREKLAPGSAHAGTVILGESCHLREPPFPPGEAGTPS